MFSICIKFRTTIVYYTRWKIFGSQWVLKQNMFKRVYSVRSKFESPDLVHPNTTVIVLILTYWSLYGGLLNKRNLYKVQKSDCLWITASLGNSPLEVLNTTLHLVSINQQVIDISASNSVILKAIDCWKESLWEFLDFKHVTSYTRIDKVFQVNISFRIYIENLRWAADFGHYILRSFYN